MNPPRVSYAKVVKHKVVRVHIIMTPHTPADPIQSPESSDPAQARPQWQTPKVSVLSLTKTLAKGEHTTDSSSTKDMS